MEGFIIQGKPRMMQMPTSNDAQDRVRDELRILEMNVVAGVGRHGHGARARQPGEVRLQPRALVLELRRRHAQSIRKASVCP